MDKDLIQKITALTEQLSKEADKSIHSPKDLYRLFHSAVNTITLLLTHVGYLETKIENLQAENQRLSIKENL